LLFLLFFFVARLSLVVFCVSAAATAGAPQSLQLQNGNASITTNSFAVQWNTPSYIGLSGIYQYRFSLSQEFGSKLIITNVNDPNTPANTRPADVAVQYTATLSLCCSSFTVHDGIAERVSLVARHAVACNRAPTTSSTSAPSTRSARRSRRRTCV
jgi:hypothetical protein